MAAFASLDMAFKGVVFGSLRRVDTTAVVAALTTPRARCTQLAPEQSTLVWIQYQRCALRSEDLGASRKVFMRARKAPGSGWQVFAASALLEWHTVKTETVRARCGVGSVSGS